MITDAKSSVFHHCPYYPDSPAQRLIYWLVLVCALCFLIALRYAFILDFWWSFDDAHHLKFAHEHHAIDYLFNPATYRKFHNLHLAPWNILAYSLNLSLFGLNPVGFYAHHLVSMCLLGISSFVFIRLWVNTGFALFGTLIFMLSPPTLIVASQLMDTHYIEGLLFTLIAGICYILAIRKNVYYLAVLGSLVYFLATASKEIYVPLPAMLFFLPVGSFKQRLQTIVPFVCISLVYVIWRNFYIIDSFSSWIHLLKFQDVFQLPWILIGFVFPASQFSVFASSILIIVLLIGSVQHSQIHLLIFVIIVCLITPLLPVSSEIHPQRFHLFSTWILCTAVSLSLANITNTNKLANTRQAKQLSIRYFCLALTLGIATFASLISLSQIKHLQFTNRNYQTVGEFVFTASPEKALYLPNYSLSANDVKTLRSALGLGAGPTVYFDPMQFYSNPKIKQNLYIFDPASAKLSNSTTDYDQHISQWRNTIKEKPLSLSLKKSSKGIEWQFGPYDDKKYSVILLSQPFSFTQIKPQGVYRANLPPISFILRYASDEGWVTYSEALSWQNNDNEILKWQRQ